MTRPKSTPSCVGLPPTQPKNIIDWRAASACDHFVQFYRTDDYLIECLSGFVADGLGVGDRTVVIATSEHRIALEERLRVKRVDVAMNTIWGNYLALDAREILSKFMVANRPHQGVFEEVVGAVVAQATGEGRRLRAFGEMVALLWMDGNRTAAIELEQLWNELGRKYSFSLFCAYPAHATGTTANGVSLEHICQAHSCVISMAG